MTREIRTCLVCGASFSAADENEFCPVCLLRNALADGIKSEESAGEELQPAPAHERLGFEHYELVTDKDGRPEELGRGAMGVTYKAMDVDLRCAVALKVISEKYLGEEAARTRFIREARAAASVRHPNVASVFHLGRKGRDYFYAMEFVEGETLDHLIKRSGRLDVKLALEITRQVASGLGAVHKKSLVHRDIKPSNIMVSFDEEALTAKIIDLGLAKATDEFGAQTTISASGAFAGTPQYASPEQVIGGEVDIRSDLYSLGISLWQMLTGQVPFRGAAVGVMAQHQHADLPLEKLEGVPQPVTSLLEVLLSKGPDNRFQTPGELLKALRAASDAIEESRTITFQSLGQMPERDFSSVSRHPQAKLGPERISLARLPVTGGDLFGREEDISFLDDAWANSEVNVVTIVAWGGVGKSTLINHWLRAMATRRYRSAELVFGWSFYRQGSSGDTSSADEFIDAALTWFGDPDARIGTASEKGMRLAKLVSQRRTLLILDGLEPLQNPPGSQEGRLRDPSLQALLKDLSAFNTGLCVITTRMPVADIADHERTSAPRRELEHLPPDAGAHLLQVLGVKGDQDELKRASEAFNGHCLALTLLGSFLVDAYNGDIRFRKEVSEHLSHDVRQGVHARKVMESYQTWFGEGPELSILRLLGLFDRPANEKALGALLKSPAIPGLTETLTDLNRAEWRAIIAKLRRARLLAGEDLHNPGQLDTHPLVREYFGEQLRSEQPETWKECNRRLFEYYRVLAPELPNSLREMEPLFLAVICGCKAGLLREALHGVYIPRIQRGSAAFAANVLGVRGTLLSVLIHFFEDGRWRSPIQTGVAGQNLSAEDQLFILMQTGLNLTATRGHATSEVRTCYERAEALCHSLDKPVVLFSALIGQWRYSLLTATLTTTMQIAERAYALAQQQNDAMLLMGACRMLTVTLYFSGDFEAAREYAKGGLELWRGGGIQSRFEEVNSPALVCLSFEALCAWHFGEITACKVAMTQAVSFAKNLNDAYACAVALFHAAFASHFDGNVAEVERLASELVELSTRQHFAQWRAGGRVFGGWARSASGRAEGIAWIEEAIGEWGGLGSMLVVPYWLGLKAEALSFAGRLPEALETIREAEALAKASGERWWLAELSRLRGRLLGCIGAEEIQIEGAFREAMKVASEQKSISLERRAQASYTEYLGKSESSTRRANFQLPLS